MSCRTLNECVVLDKAGGLFLNTVGLILSPI